MEVSVEYLYRYTIGKGVDPIECMGKIPANTDKDALNKVHQQMDNHRVKEIILDWIYAIDHKVDITK